MTRRVDMQIVWVVLLATLFWVAIWRHETVVELFRKSPIPGLLHWIEYGRESER